MAVGHGHTSVLFDSMLLWGSVTSLNKKKTSLSKYFHTGSLAKIGKWLFFIPLFWAVKGKRTRTNYSQTLSGAMLQAWTKLETEKYNWKPTHWTTIEQSCKQWDKCANCWWNVSVGLLLNKVANCQTLLHASRSQWPTHIRIAADLSANICENHSDQDFVTANNLKSVMIFVTFFGLSLSPFT